MECKRQQGKLCKTFLRNVFCFFPLYYPVILFKLRESLGLCILSKKFFSKLNLLFSFLKLEFLEAPQRWVGHGSVNILMECEWEEQPTQAYTKIRTLLILAVTQLFEQSQEKGELDLALHFFIATTVRPYSLQSCSFKVDI